MRIYRDLLFLHGHVVDPVLARQLDADDPPAAGAGEVDTRVLPTKAATGTESCGSRSEDPDPVAAP